MIYLGERSGWPTTRNPHREGASAVIRASKSPRIIGLFIAKLEPPDGDNEGDWDDFRWLVDRDAGNRREHRRPEPTAVATAGCFGQ